MTLSQRPVCETCGHSCALGASENGHRRYFCCNTSCADFGKRTYTVVDQVGSASPDRKEVT